jgi:hypothetical protein
LKNTWLDQAKLRALRKRQESQKNLKNKILKKLKKKKKLLLSLITSKAVKLTMSVLLSPKRIPYSVSKVRKSIPVAEVEGAIEEEEAEVVKKVEHQEEEEANRIWKSMTLNSQLYEEVRVKSTCDQRKKDRRDLQ